MSKAKIYSKTQEIGEAVFSVGDFTMGGIFLEDFLDEEPIKRLNFCNQKNRL